MLQYKNKVIKNKEDLMSKYGSQEFASPYRSTIPLIELFFNNESEMEKIIPGFQTYNCVFEYGTPVKGIRNIDRSYTDLMIYNENKGFCIEAKRTEGAYPTVKKWFEIGNYENKKVILSRWLSIINIRCKTNLVSKDIEVLPCQMIHRFASACNINENSELLYFCFDLKNNSLSYYNAQLEKISELINRKVSIKLISFSIEKTKKYEMLEKKWDLRMGKLDLSDEIQHLLLKEKSMAISIMGIKEF